MSFPRRPPSRIALELLDCIDQREGKASKWDLVKVLGNESQFQHWVTNFLLKEKFIKEIQASNHSFYCKTENGEFFQTTKERQDSACATSSERKETAEKLLTNHINGWFIAYALVVSQLAD